VTADRVDAPCYSNVHVITDRSNGSRDDDKSENLCKCADGCRPNVNAEATITDVDDNDINDNEFNVT
jgi:hypothetical protein